MAIWENNDGLKVRFGADKTRDALTGKTAEIGDENAVIADIVYDRLADAGTAEILGKIPLNAIPKDALITGATLRVSEAFDSASDTATLTIGLHKEDGTAIDADGIDAGIAQTAIDAVGDEVSCDGALVGGAALTNNGYISVTVGTEAFTAGRAKLRVQYYRP